MQTKESKSLSRKTQASSNFFSVLRQNNNSYFNKTEEFLMKLWRKYIDMKGLILSNGKSFKENNKNGEYDFLLDNKESLKFAKSIVRVIELHENYQNMLNYKKLLQDEEYLEIKENILGYKFEEDDDLLRKIRGSFAHRFYSFKHDANHFILECKIDKNKTLNIKDEDLTHYVKKIEEYINYPTIKFSRYIQYKKLGEKKYGDPNYPVFLDDELAKMVNARRINFEIRQSIISMQDDIILNNLDKNKQELDNLLFEKINKVYADENTKFDKKEKLTAWLMINSPKELYSAELVNYLKFLISTEKFEKKMQNVDNIGEFTNFLDEKIDIKKLIAESEEGIESYRDVLKTIRNAVVHNNLEHNIVNGEITIYNLNHKGLEKKRSKKKIGQKIDLYSGNTYKKVAEWMNEFKFKEDEKIRFAKLGISDLLKLIDYLQTETQNEHEIF